MRACEGARVKKCYRSGMRRLVMSVACAAAIVAAGCAAHLPDQDRRILDASPSAKTSPEALWKEFQTDARAANRAYHGRAIDVSGKIGAVLQDAAGSRIMFTVQPPPGTAAVEARLLDDRAAATVAGLSAPQRLTLRCFVEGLETNLILKSCIKP